MTDSSRIPWDTYFILLAKMASTRATCPRRRVGCVIVDRNKRVISTGYNGSAPGAPHCTDVGCDVCDDCCVRTTHAETNAILYASKASLRGSTLYCTDFACLDCAKRIVRSGIVELVYLRPYTKNVDLSRILFHEAGVVFRQVVPFKET